MRPPRLCCGIKHTKSENLPPYAPQSICFYLLSPFSPGAYLPFPGGCGAGEKPGCAPRGRVRPSHAPCKISTERYFTARLSGSEIFNGIFAARAPTLLPSLLKCWSAVCGLGRVGRVNSSSRTFWAAASGQERQALTYLPAHRVQLNRNCAGSGEVQRRHAYDECPQKFR